MKEIQLTQGKVALVDDEDYEWLNQWKWCAAKDIGTFYAARTDRTGGKQTTIKMHRLIMGVSDPKILVDHKNGNGLYNIKDNLRLANKSENSTNRIAKRNGTSKYLGVNWDKNKEKWQVSISKNGKSNYVGLFLNEDDAAKAYNEKAILIHGEFARLNII